MALDDGLLTRILQQTSDVRARARLAAVCARFARVVADSWNSLTLCSPREAPLAWVLKLLRERELAFLEELTLHGPDAGVRSPDLVSRGPRKFTAEIRPCPTAGSAVTVNALPLHQGWEPPRAALGGGAGSVLLVHNVLPRLYCAAGLTYLELELFDAFSMVGLVSLSRVSVISHAWVLPGSALGGGVAARGDAHGAAYARGPPSPRLRLQPQAAGAGVVRRAMRARESHAVRARAASRLGAPHRHHQVRLVRRCILCVTCI